MAPAISRKAKLLAMLLGLFLIALDYWSHRRSQIEQLYSTAISPTSNLVSAKSAIRALNAFNGSDAHRLLLKIATSDRDFLDGRQDTAIELLVARHDADLTKHVASLLQPSIGLARREAVAIALENAVCDDDCIRFVLHYLERRWSGYGIREDITNQGVHFGSPSIEKQQSELVERLNHVLRINSKSTLTVLQDTYGLAGPAPSDFALFLLTVAQIREACPLLVASRQKLIDSSKQAELEQTSRELRCPVQ